jgi:quaternary ammonium compound-resistance protein SugE
VNAWLWLLAAGLLEVGFATSLKLMQSNSSYLWIFLVCAYLSFDFLSRALKSIPLGTAYALWTGIGSIGAIIVGVLMFKESLSLERGLVLVLLVAALIGLKMATPSKKPVLETTLGGNK